MSFPLTKTFPESGISNPQITCKRVDLPDPDAPISPRLSPSSILKDKFSKTFKGVLF